MTLRLEALLLTGTDVGLFPCSVKLGIRCVVGPAAATGAPVDGRACMGTSGVIGRRRLRVRAGAMGLAAREVGTDVVAAVFPTEGMPAPPELVLKLVVTIAMWILLLQVLLSVRF